MSDGRSIGLSSFLPASEVNRRVMRTFRATDGAVYRAIINQDGYEIIEDSREENVRHRDTLSQCISRSAGPFLRPFLS